MRGGCLANTLGGILGWEGPFMLVRTLLGHRSLQTTLQIYFDLHPEEHRRVWEALREEDDPDASLNDLLVQIAETRESEREEVKMT